MSYYAQGHGQLALKDGVTYEQVEAIVSEWDDGWEPFGIDEHLLELTFNAKYRGIEDDLRSLVPFVKPGEYVQFVGEDDAVWRLRFGLDGTIETMDASFT